MKLYEYNQLPDLLINAHPSELVPILRGPSLIHIEGQKKEPIFITTLLHGNETTGFYALQRLLKKYNDNLPRSVSIFIGNILSAEKGVRHLPNQIDYNRIWNGGTRPENKIAHSVIQKMKERRPFASIDIHNNTGENPFYACVNSIETHHLSLAQKFSDLIVYFIEPHEVQSMAFSKFCPSIALECGLPGKEEGIKKVEQFLERLLKLDYLGPVISDPILYFSEAGVDF